ncbi:MAG: hypothetical protein ACPG9R_15020, partial [Marinobacter salsuginis]
LLCVSVIMRKGISAARLISWAKYIMALSCWSYGGRKSTQNLVAIDFRARSSIPDADTGPGGRGTLFQEG